MLSSLISHETMDSTKRVGVLLYNIHAAKTDLFVRLAKAFPKVRFKLFPLVEHPHEKSELLEYRDAKGRARVYTSASDGKRPPEVGTMSLNLRIIWSVLRYSDIVILFGCQAFPAVATALIGRFLRKPVVLVYQSVAPDLELKRHPLIRFAKKILIRNTSVCVAQSPPSIANLKEVYGVPESRIVYAPYGAGIADWEARLAAVSADRESVRNDLAVASSDILLLFVGWLIPLKRPDLLIEAVASLRGRGVPVKALVIGTPPPNDSWAQCIADRIGSLGLENDVICLGRVPRDRIAQYFRAADVFVMPSMRDTWNKAAVAAACAGLPVVTTDAVGVAGHVIQDGVNGYVVPSGDSASLTKAIAALQDPVLRNEMGQRGPGIVAAFSSVEREWAGFLAAMEEVGMLH